MASIDGVTMLLEEVTISQEQMTELLLKNIEEDVEILIGENFENLPPGSLDDDVLDELPIVTELDGEKVEETTPVQTETHYCPTCSKPYKREFALRRHMEACSVETLKDAITKRGKFFSKLHYICCLVIYQTRYTEFR